MRRADTVAILITPDRSPVCAKRRALVEFSAQRAAPAACGCCWCNDPCSASLPRNRKRETLESREETMTVRTIVSHGLIAGAAAAATYLVATHGQAVLVPSTAQAQAPAAPTGQRVAE